MQRAEFLEKFWKRYPAADPGWQDVRAFLSSDLDCGVVAGRASFESNQQDSFFLTSAGARVRVRFSENAKWMREEGLTVCPFKPSLLQSGDLIAVQLESKTPSILTNGQSAPPTPLESGSGDFIWNAGLVMLLAPSRSETPLKNGETHGFTIERSENWANFLDSVRAYFREHDFIEAQTPTLVPSPGTEPFLEPFLTEWRFGSSLRQYYLPTSPEFHLKKMLSLGWTRIFELKSCFRNGEISDTHQPEFLMLEWYRAYNNLDTIAKDVEGLIQWLVSSFGMTAPSLVKVHMTQLFAEAFPGFELKANTSLIELQMLARKHHIDFSQADSWDDLFFRLFLERIEPGLGAVGPILVHGYPPSQAALSRIGEDGFADRFEVYWRGLEIANAFHELNDPEENLRRFQEDARKKKALGKDPVPMDSELLSCIQNGMPPSGGIALGVDRLFMALFNLKTISETRPFPVQP